MDDFMEDRRLLEETLESSARVFERKGDGRWSMFYDGCDVVVHLEHREGGVVRFSVGTGAFARGETAYVLYALMWDFDFMSDFGIEYAFGRDGEVVCFCDMQIRDVSEWRILKASRILSHAVSESKRAFLLASCGSKPIPALKISDQIEFLS